MKRINGGPEPLPILPSEEIPTEAKKYGRPKKYDVPFEGEEYKRYYKKMWKEERTEEHKEKTREYNREYYRKYRNENRQKIRDISNAAYNRNKEKTKKTKDDATH